MSHTRRWTTTSYGRLHHVVSIGPPRHARAVVLVHGQATSHRYMVPLLETLGPDFRTYCPDFPGFGYSTKPHDAIGLDGLADALAAWMTAVGLDRVHLIGNSLGCNIIAEFGLRHTDRVDRAVLQGPTLPPHLRRADRAILSWMFNGMREPRMGLVLFQDYWDAGLRRTLQTFRALLDHPLEDRLAAFPRPALVVRGTRDPIVSHDWARALADRLPQGRLAEVEGVAHTMNYFAPEKLAAVAVPFLAEAEADAPAEPESAP